MTTIDSFKFIVGGCLFLLLSACASKLTIDYRSDPPGANIYLGGKLWGYSPVRLNFEPTQEFKEGGCMFIKEVSAVWASGAKVGYPSTRACHSLGYNQTFLFTRPDVPGREIDANFALQLDRNRMMRAPKSCFPIVIRGVWHTICD